MFLLQKSALLLLLLSLSTVLVSSQEQESACLSTDTLEACALESKDCVIDSSGDEVCGPCLPGFIDFPSRGCINITSDLTLEDFIDTFRPFYKEDPEGDSAATRLVRLRLLKESAQFIAEYYRNHTNATFDGNSVELALTAFSADGPDEYVQRSGFRPDIDWTRDEYGKQIPTSDYSMFTSDSGRRTQETPVFPSKLDWRDKNAVTEVKDQGRCGCCWAVSMVGAIEGAAAANPENKGYLQNLSWQQLISCNDMNYGCDGGSIVTALGYSWLNDFGGVSRYNEYPYEDYEGETTTTCAVDDKPLAVEISEPTIVLDFGLPTDFDVRVNMMKQALQVAPVSMTIKSSCNTMSNYRKGILTDDGDCACSSSSCIDHAVLMVGYDDTSDPSCWILKNSWGTKWGEDGYFRISQQEKGAYGLFGVVSHGVQAQLAQNVTAEVPDDEIKQPLEAWQIVLIVLAGICVCLCIVGIVRKLVQGDK